MPLKSKSMHPKVDTTATFWVVRDKVSGFYYEAGRYGPSVWPELLLAKMCFTEQSAKTLARKCNKNKHFDCDTWEVAPVSLTLR